jgi:hypothetical protein
MTTTVPPERRRRVILTPPSVAARAASEKLTRALINAAAKGQRPPCGDPETHHLWLSEEAQERRLAKQWCLDCPCLAECLAAAEAQKETFGVFGAKDFTRNPRKPKDPVSPAQSPSTR